MSSCLILGLPLFFILLSSRLELKIGVEIGITFTNATCPIFDIARVLNTVILPAIDKFHILQSLKNFQFLKLDS